LKSGEIQKGFHKRESQYFRSFGIEFTNSMVLKIDGDFEIKSLHLNIPARFHDPFN